MPVPAFAFRRVCPVRPFVMGMRTYQLAESFGFHEVTSHRRTAGAATQGSLLPASASRVMSLGTQARRHEQAAARVVAQPRRTSPVDATLDRQHGEVGTRDVRAARRLAHPLDACRRRQVGADQPVDLAASPSSRVVSMNESPYGADVAAVEIRVRAVGADAAAGIRRAASPRRRRPSCRSCRATTDRCPRRCRWDPTRTVPDCRARSCAGARRRGASVAGFDHDAPAFTARRM